MKKNDKGFTLVEVIAVIVILGIILIIAVPAVSDYIVNSRKSSYISNVKAYLETVRAEYEMKYYGSLLYDDEIMIVPIELVELEQGDGGKTPFGVYEEERNYVVIVPERKTYQYYANFLDSAGYGVNMLPANSLSKEYLEQYNVSSVPSYLSYGEDVRDTFTFNGKNYEYCGRRNSENAPENVDTDEDYIIVLCENA